MSYIRRRDSLSKLILAQGLILLYLSYVDPELQEQDRSVTASTFLTDVPMIAGRELSYYVNPTGVCNKSLLAAIV